MRQTKSNLTAAKQPDEWAQRWEEALRSTILPVRPEGDGWKSTPELCDELNISKQAVMERMKKLERHGIMERAWGKTGPSLAKTLFFRPTPNKHPTARPLL